MENKKTGTTLWSVFPLGIVSQGETDRAFNSCLSSFRRPYTEVGISLYVVFSLMSTGPVFLATLIFSITACAV